VTAHPLDDPARAALTGPHAHLAEQRGRVLRYRPDVAAFYAMPDAADERDWRDAADLAGPGGTILLAGSDAPPPPSWRVVARLPGQQMAGEGVVGLSDAECVRLGEADLPAMLDLVARTEPGPFRPRALDLGAYLGVKRAVPAGAGAAPRVSTAASASAMAAAVRTTRSPRPPATARILAAMAGERLHPPGWCEVSAVCTDPASRGQGLASRLVRTVAAGIRERGESPFLHVADTNTGALRLYRALGFRIRRPITFLVLRAPD
jgi:ribosomal protein S18 acetylase RimI-like enzyme